TSRPLRRPGVCTHLTPLPSGRDSWLPRFRAKLWQAWSCAALQNAFPIQFGNAGRGAAIMSAESRLPPVRAYLERTDPFTRFMIDAGAKLDRTHRELAAAITDAAYELNQVASTVHASAVWRWERGVVAHEDVRRWIAYALQRHGIDVNEADLDAL